MHEYSKQMQLTGILVAANRRPKLRNCVTLRNTTYAANGWYVTIRTRAAAPQLQQNDYQWSLIRGQHPRWLTTRNGLFWNRFAWQN